MSLIADKLHPEESTNNIHVTVSDMVTNGANGVLHEDTVKDSAGLPTTAPVSTALSPNNLTAVPACTENIRALVVDLPMKDDAARLELLAHARSLVQALETPRETMIKHCWAQVSS